jgi:hypothetical protein
MYADTNKGKTVPNDLVALRSVVEEAIDRTKSSRTATWAELQPRPQACAPTEYSNKKEDRECPC